MSATLPMPGAGDGPGPSERRGRIARRRRAERARPRRHLRLPAPGRIICAGHVDFPSGSVGEHCQPLRGPYFWASPWRLSRPPIRTPIRSSPDRTAGQARRGEPAAPEGDRSDKGRRPDPAPRCPTAAASSDRPPEAGRRPLRFAYEILDPTANVNRKQRLILERRRDGTLGRDSFHVHGAVTAVATSRRAAATTSSGIRTVRPHLSGDPAGRSRQTKWPSPGRTTWR